MPLRKTDRAFVRRHLLNFVALGVPFGLVFWFAFVMHGEGRTGWFIGALVVASIIALVGLVRQQRMKLRYHCPECGAHLPYSAREDRRIQFHCTHCDVVWDTRMLEGSI